MPAPTVFLRKARVKELPAPPGTSQHPEPFCHRRFALYGQEEQPVLIDLKKYGEDPNDEVGDKVYDRVQELAEALGLIRSEEFLTLRCKGIYEDVENSQFCFVYELPSFCQRPLDAKPPPSLLDYIDTRFKPSVTARVRLAHRLALSVRRLHEEGWLHKGIRSENILLLKPRQDGPRSLENPQLAGFDFARREGPGEYSEKPLSVTRTPF